MTYDIGLLLDGLILVFLSVTIFYAARLTLFMKAFRAGRTGMEILIRDLNLTISKAETSIQNMKQHASARELELREIVNEAKFLSDELRFMNETGDGLANRLEKLADRNRELVDLMENAGGIGTQRITPFDPSKKPTPKKKSFIVEEDNFEIEDFEMDDLDADDENDFYALEDGAYRGGDVPSSPFVSHKSKVNTDAKNKVRSFAIFDRDYSYDAEDDDREEEVVADNGFRSRAEQDLYEALQRRKRVSETS